MSEGELAELVHADGKLHVLYTGPGSLIVAGMLFPHGVEVRLSPAKAGLIPDDIWQSGKITILEPPPVALIEPVPNYAPAATRYVAPLWRR